jgi:hypothetical protein
VKRRASTEPAPGERPDHERAERYQRGKRRQPTGARQRKPKEHDIAGHVGDEYVPQHEITGRIH